MKDGGFAFRLRRLNSKRFSRLGFVFESLNLAKPKRSDSRPGFNIISPNFNLAKPKRSVSPVVATALLIMLVIVLAIIIFLWARGWLFEQIEKFGQPIDKICEGADFDANLIEGTTLEVVNRGNAQINSFEVKYFYEDKSEVENLGIPVNKGEAKSQKVFLKTDSKRIQLFPVLLGSRGKNKLNYYTCLEQGKFIK